MTGGLIQLVAYGVEDLFLTQDPQITFFKIIYRRHTNFSTETVPQFFAHTPDFGQKVTCLMSKAGDLARKIYFVVVLPRVPSFVDNDNNIDEITKFAWVRRLGYALIRNVEIQLGEQLIDRQYGEWMHIWAELTNSRDRGIDELIGNIPYLTDFSNGKSSLKLFIPLQFWFNRTTGLALPLINLQYNDIKINVEISDADKLFRVAPTNYIVMADDIVHYQQYEYIEQTVNNVQAAGIFTNYDVTTKRLYYLRLTRNKFLGSQLSVSTNSVFDDTTSQNYKITGRTTKFEGLPEVDTIERVHRYNKFRNFSIRNAFLLVEYIFLDEEERVKFVQRRHEYLIEQLEFSGEKQLTSTNNKVKVGFNHPTKLMVWVAQMDYLTDTTVNDTFNFTNSWEYVDGKQVGTNIIKEETLALNGRERITFRAAEYFSQIQPYQHFEFQPSTGINMYSFSINPNKYQPSSSLNASRIDDIFLQLKVDEQVEFNNIANMRIYTLAYNLIRISHGLGGLVFTD